jgi:hypothetical protein
VERFLAREEIMRRRDRGIALAILAGLLLLAISVWPRTNEPAPRDQQAPVVVERTSTTSDLEPPPVKREEVTHAESPVQEATPEEIESPAFTPASPWQPEQVGHRVLETLKRFRGAAPDLQELLALIEEIARSAEEIARSAPAPSASSTIDGNFRWWSLDGEGTARIALGRGAVDGDPAYRLRVDLDPSAPLPQPFTAALSGIDVTAIDGEQGARLTGEVMNRVTLDDRTFRTLCASPVPTTTLGYCFQIDPDGSASLARCTARTVGREGGFLDLSDAAALPRQGRPDIMVHYHGGSAHRYDPDLASQLRGDAASRVLDALQVRVPGRR